MPYTLDWSTEDDTILIIQLEAPLTWDDYHQMLDKLDATASTHLARFDVINIPKATPPTGNPIPHFKRMSSIVAKHDQIGLYITINPAHGNVIVRTLTTFFNMRGLSMSKGEFVPTIEAAYARIMADRERQTMKP